MNAMKLCTNIYDSQRIKSVEFGDALTLLLVQPSGQFPAKTLVFFISFSCTLGLELINKY